jgi:hypothetical protein
MKPDQDLTEVRLLEFFSGNSNIAGLVIAYFLLIHVPVVMYTECSCVLRRNLQEARINRKAELQRV